MIFHIPHASTTIPGDIRGQFVLDDDALSIEILKMNDTYTDKLFWKTASPARRRQVEKRLQKAGEAVGSFDK